MKIKNEIKNIVLFIVLVLFICLIPCIYNLFCNMPYKVKTTVSRVDNTYIYLNDYNGKEYTILKSDYDFKIGNRIDLKINKNNTDNTTEDDYIIDYKIIK